VGELQVQEIEAIDDYDSSGIAWPWVAIAGACLLLVALLQIEGAALSCLILVASFLLSRYHPYSQETAALKASIVLSREDIEDTLRKYEDFLYKNDTESIADRTLHRPALADENCTDPDISSFHFLASTAVGVAAQTHRCAGARAQGGLVTGATICPASGEELPG